MAFARALRQAVRGPEDEAYAATGADDSRDDLGIVAPIVAPGERDRGAPVGGSGGEAGPFDPAAPVAPGPEPTPLGTLLAAAVLLLLVTNLAWFVFATGAGAQSGAVGGAESGGAETGADERAIAGQAPTSVLPSGVRLRAVPDGAKVLRLGVDGLREIGETPMVADPKISPDGRLELELRREGHTPTRIDVINTPDGPDFVVHLPAAAR